MPFCVCFRRRIKDAPKKEEQEPARPPPVAPEQLIGSPPSYRFSNKPVPLPSAPPVDDYSSYYSDDEFEDVDAIKTKNAELEAELAAYKTKARHDKKVLETRVKALEKTIEKFKKASTIDRFSKNARRAEYQLRTAFGDEFVDTYAMECEGFIEAFDSSGNFADVMREKHLVRLRKMHAEFIETGRSDIHEPLDLSLTIRMTQLAEKNADLRRQIRNARSSNQRPNVDPCMKVKCGPSRYR